MSTSILEWLGQSGFILRARNTIIACDLYLSDNCRKISKLDHTRLMPIPVTPEKLPDIDHYLITHPHGDHFDTATVEPLLLVNSRTVFYGPPSINGKISANLAVHSERFQRLRSLSSYDLSSDVRLIALPAAHEELEKDENGEYIAFSYLLLLDDCRKAVFFGGDTIPFPGQGEMIRRHVPDGYRLIMILPVNGRDAERAALGFKGNLTLKEAISLYRECHADLMIPCHFGMFALNDIREVLTGDVFAAEKCHAVIPQVSVPIEL